jgi:hypothetical protein
VRRSPRPRPNKIQPTKTKILAFKQKRPTPRPYSRPPPRAPELLSIGFTIIDLGVNRKQYSKFYESGILSIANKKISLILQVNHSS